MISLILAAAVAAQSSTVSVTFSGLTPYQGHLDVELCTAAEYVRFTCARHLRLKVEGSQLIADFHGVPAGRYAVMSYQDVNNDSKINRDLVGRPTEPWGYSGTPEFVMGPPSFDSVAIDVPASGTTLSIHMEK